MRRLTWCDRVRELFPYWRVRHEAWQQAVMQQFPGADVSGVMRPIFVLGCGHSGTSVMLAILDNHPAIHAIATETNIFMKPPTERLDAFEVWARDTLEAGALRWAEKTPMHVYKIRNILYYYPQAQILLMLRDGRDVYCSFKKRYGSPYRGLGRWVDENRAGLRYHDHRQVHVVRYEDLVKRTQPTLTGVFEFLGLPYEPEVARLGERKRRWYADNVDNPESENGKKHDAYRNWQINQPLFDGSGKWLKEMTDEDKVLFKRRAQPMLERLGYAADKAW
jgi:hypothetical protein